MIFTPHIVIGAAIGAKTHNLGLIIISGLLTHLIMDKFPHWDYSVTSDIKNFRKTKSIKSLFPPILKSTIDVIFGLLIVFLIVWQKNILNFEYLPFIIFGIFFSLLMDIIELVVVLFGTDYFLKKCRILHYKFLHHNKEKEGKITFLNILTEILVTIIAIIILFS